MVVAFSSASPIFLPTPLQQNRCVRGMSVQKQKCYPRAQLDLGSSKSTDGFPDAVPLQAPPHDQLLGELMFSEPDALGALIIKRNSEIDADFYAFIDDKLENSVDLEERTTLRLFKEALKQLQEEVVASQVDSVAKSEPKNADAATKAYNELIDTFVSAQGRGEEELKNSVVLQYERVDMRMLEILNGRILSSAAEKDSAALKEVLECITNVMNERVSSAAVRLNELFTTPGGPDGMRKKMRSLAESGGIDEAFVLLLQSNLDAARKGGKEQVVKVIEFLMNEVTSMLEEQMPAEIQLIRRLLRTESRDVRIKMLFEALERKTQVAVAGGGMSSGVKVDGKAFVDALRELIEKYGNVEPAFVKKLDEIGEESEAVARKIFGIDDKELEEVQEEAFHKRRVSVWDLGNVEVAEEAQGRKAGWEGRLGAIPQGFNEDGKMVI